ncbi:MAG: hypothetical protein DLD55_02440 [candidate division SR1 bacterium]|nr:MAG: hypothetical protein DLD55_02440 [candidate division SR1 bacterium]
MDKNRETIESKLQKRERLESILAKARSEIMGTAEKMEKLAPFIRELEQYPRKDLKRRLNFTGPNNWNEDSGWENPNIDNPHRYGFVQIDGLYNQLIGDGLYFRIDTLEWDGFENRYIPCKPTLKIDEIIIRLNLEKSVDPIKEKARLYKKVLKDRNIYPNLEKNKYEDEAPYGRTYYDETTGKYVSKKPTKINAPEKRERRIAKKK